MVLHCCDFRNIIHDIPKDAYIITDPPYNIDFKYDTYRDNNPNYVDMISSLKGRRLAIIGYPEVAIRYFRDALGDPLRVLAWCYNTNTAKNFRLIYFYGQPPNLSNVKSEYKNPNDKRIKERISKGLAPAIYDWFSDIQIVKNVSKEKTIHPCPIPEKLIERIILLWDVPMASPIFDPFMGCGTVPLVAKPLGHNFIGCEISPLYFKEAENRIGDHPAIGR